MKNCEKCNELIQGGRVCPWCSIDRLRAELELERRDHQILINALEDGTIRRYNEDCDEEKWLLSMCIDIDDDGIETWAHPVFESLEGAFRTWLVERFDKAMEEE